MSNESPERRSGGLEVLILGFAALGSLGIVVRMLGRLDWIADTHGDTMRTLVFVAATAAVVACVGAGVQALRFVRGRLTLSAARVRAFIVILALGWATFHVTGMPYAKISFELLAALTSGALAIAAMLGGPIASRLPKPLVGFTDLALTNLVVAVVLLEGSLEVLSRAVPSPLFATSESPASLIAGFRFEPGRIHYGFAADENGFLDESPAGRPDGSRFVVCIGDSFSTGAVPHRFHYTTVAESLLESTTVYNMGVDAIGPPEYLRLLEREAKPLEPDALVVTLFVGNDMTDTTYRRPSGGALRRIFDRDRLLFLTVPKRMLAARHAGSEDAAKPSGHVVQGLDRIRKVFPFVDDPQLEPPTFEEAGFLDLEANRAFMNCRDDDALYGPFFSAVEEIIAAAGDTPLGFLIHPDEFQVEDELWRECIGRKGPLDRDLPQRKIRAWLDERDLPYIDLLPRMRAAEPWTDGRPHLYHLRNTHYNARGNRIAGEALAELIERLQR